MVKTNIFIGFLLLAVAFSSNAHDRDQIDQLEKEIQELKLRVSELESLLIKSNTVQEVVTTGEGWKSITNWRKLTTDMSTSDVQKILGEPHYVSGGTVAYWDYPNDGRVFFYKGKVSQWQEPRR